MELVGAHHPWATGTPAHGVLLSKYRFLNWFYSANLEPCGHTATINHQHGMALYCIGMGNSVNVPLMIYNMVKIPSAAKNATLQFGVLITGFLISKDVIWRQYDRVQRIQGPINRRSLQQSEAHITEGDDDDFDEEAEGAQDNVSDRPTSFANEVDKNENEIACLNAVDENMTTRFKTVDESVAIILARLGHQ